MGKRKFYLTAVTVLFLVMLAGCGNKDEVKEVKDNTEMNTVVEGENGVFTQDVFVAEDKNVYDEMMKYINADNQEAFNQLYNEGNVLSFEEGTEVTMLELGVATSLVKVAETGQKVYVPAAFVKTKID
ncbi:hypothetical protein [Bacillus badius]|uniref:hypothetical protein n=1 Tax=Bacillus badius TaxID=1455 RepID=UPI000597BDC2|nr:hypothetical protein [Bacillus badius]KIL72549.1 hypothetical protein SD78_4134 [Bacillus badius]